MASKKVARQAGGPAEDAQPQVGAKRVTVTLSKTDVERLKQIAEGEDVSQNEAIRRALATEAFVKRTLAAGRKILVEDADGNVREVHFVK